MAFMAVWLWYVNLQIVCALRCSRQTRRTNESNVATGVFPRRLFGASCCRRCTTRQTFHETPRPCLQLFGGLFLNYEMGTSIAKPWMCTSATNWQRSTVLCEGRGHVISSSVDSRGARGDHILLIIDEAQSQTASCCTRCLREARLSAVENKSTHSAFWTDIPASSP